MTAIIGANNIIFCNVQESNSNQSDKKIAYDINRINITIASILVNACSPTPLKVIRLGSYQPGKQRPTTAILNLNLLRLMLFRTKKKLLSTFNSAVSNNYFYRSNSLPERLYYEKIEGRGIVSRSNRINNQIYKRCA